MDIYDYAMQMEKDGELYYRHAGAQVAHKGIRNILTMLADAEVSHYRIFENMKKGGKVQIGDSKVLAGVKNIFLKMAESSDYTLAPLSEIDVYKKAQDIEQKSMDFYREKGDKVADAYERTIFLKVADQEKRHYLILENIIDFLSRPQQWLENPEWYHMEDY